MKISLAALAFFVGLGTTDSLAAEPMTVVQAAKEMSINGEVFAGGDPISTRLEEGRQAVQSALSLIDSGYELGSLCREGDADAGKSEDCRSFILEQAGALLVASRAPFSWVSVPLTEGGKTVAARTPLGPQGSIVFHYGSVRDASRETLIALIGHELGHKVATKEGHFIDDNHPWRHFLSGRAFLDRVGAALSEYSKNLSLPRQSPPRLPEGVALSCEVKPGERRFLWGLAVDTRAEAPSQLELSTWEQRMAQAKASNPTQARLAFGQIFLGSPQSHEALAHRWFEKYWLRPAQEDEWRLTARRLDEGLPQDALVASLVGDPEYAHAHGAPQGSASYLSAVYWDLAGRAPTAPELGFLLRASRQSDAPSLVQQLFRQVPEFAAHQLREWYQAYLNRNPTSAEVETQGSRLRAGASWEAIQAQILASPEYGMLQALRWKPCSLSPSTMSR